MDSIIKEILGTAIPKPSSSGGSECLNGEDEFTTDNGEVSNRKVPKKLWIIGDSEVSMFQREKDILESKWEMQLKTDFASGRTLRECFQVIRSYMNSEVDMIILWTLTSTAWVDRTICERGQRINIIGPGPFFKLEDIVQEMRNINSYVKNINPKCKLFLIVPTVKDMFHYNVERIVEKLGNKREAKRILERDIELNSTEMQEYSIFVYKKLMALLTKECKWPNKLVWAANNVIDEHYKDLRSNRIEYGNVPHHIRYLNERCPTLKVDILPDGLHGNRRFVEMFVKSFWSILHECELFQLKTNIPQNLKLINATNPQILGPESRRRNEMRSINVARSDQSRPNLKVINTKNPQILSPESRRRNEMRSPINVARRDRSVSPKTRNLEPRIFSKSDTQNSPIVSESPTRERIKQRYNELLGSRSSRTSEINHTINHNIVQPDPKILLLQKSVSDQRHIQARVEKLMTEILPANSTDKISKLNALDSIAAVCLRMKKIIRNQ